MNSKLYDIAVTSISGESKTLGSYRGKVLLVVNTASQCGFTPQYEGLQNLYEKYREGGLEILAFPCNQFGAQEPGGSEEIKDFCETRFKTTFPLFEKIEVNGENTHPLYELLKSSLPGLAGTKMIKWNFTKFLIDRDGRPVKRFAPTDTPEKIESFIKDLL